MCKYPSREYFEKEYILNNKSRKQLAEENHVSIATIKTHLYEKHILKPPLIDYDTLYGLYVTDRKTMKEIAKLLNHDRNAVARAIEKYGIKKENHYVQYDDALDDEWLELYIEKGLSISAIAAMYNVSHSTVRTHLHRNGIKLRSISDAERLWHNKQPLSEDVFNYDIMYNLYVVERLTLNAIGKRYACTARSVRDRLVALGIPIRTQSEVKVGLLTGENHPNWKGGMSTLNQRLREFHNTNLAPLSRVRDKYSCQICGTHNNLHSHHVVPFSWIVSRQLQNHPDLDPISNADELYEIITHDKEFLDIANLITYCRNCHLFVVHGYKKTISNQDSDKKE